MTNKIYSELEMSCFRLAKSFGLWLVAAFAPCIPESDIFHNFTSNYGFNCEPTITRVINLIMEKFSFEFEQKIRLYLLRLDHFFSLKYIQTLEKHERSHPEGRGGLFLPDFRSHASKWI